MKRRNKLFVLLGVLAASIIGIVIVNGVSKHEDKIKEEENMILSVSVQDVKTLAWEYDDVSLSYTKDETWKYDDDGDFPVDDEKIEDLLSTFENFYGSFTIEDVDDYGQYGLDEPVCTIKFSTDDKDYEVLLGEYSKMDSQRYVSVGDGNAYLVENDPFESFEIELSDTILNDEIPSFENISSVVFAGEQNYSISYVEDSNQSYCESDKYFTTSAGKVLPLDTYRVENYCADITLLSLDEYASYNVTEQELSDWGLAEPELTVTINYKPDDDKKSSEEQFVISFGQNQEEYKKQQEALEKEEEYDGEVTCYARVGDSKIVYVIDSEDYENLIKASYDDLRHNEVLTADFDSIYQIEISVDGSYYTITSKKEALSEDERTYYYKEEEIEITDLRSKITDLSVNEFDSIDPDQKEEISLTFRLDNDNYPEIKVAFYRYDGENCVCVLDGESIGLVERSEVVDLIEAVNAIVL